MLRAGWWAACEEMNGGFTEKGMYEPRPLVSAARSEAILSECDTQAVVSRSAPISGAYGSSLPGQSQAGRFCGSAEVFTALGLEPKGSSSTASSDRGESMRRAGGRILRLSSLSFTRATQPRGPPWAT